ncbi:MAG: hypothetical protein ABSE59_09625 [Opitutaceae bacterium]|jgi:hypothetical protein
MSSDHGRSSGDLLAAIAAPELYQQNPFRQTGLSVLAGARDSAKRLDALRQTLELRTAEYRWAFAPGLAPSAEQLLDVAQTLKDPRRRFAYEFFWFWPETYPQESTDQALGCLARREVEAAIEIWHGSEAAGSAVAAHNLAVYHHLQALGGEQVWSVTDKLRGEVWTEAFARWHLLAQSADLWGRVEARLRELDEPQLPPAIAGGLRASLPRVLAAINAELVVRYAQRDDPARAKWHAAFLHGVNGRIEGGAHLLELCARPLATQLELRLSAAEQAARVAPGDALDEIIRLIEPPPRELELVEQLCGLDSLYGLDLRSSFASAVIDRLVLYQRESHDNAACLRWLKRLRGWRLKGDLATRIQEICAVVAGGSASLPPGDMDEAGELVLILDGHRLHIDPSGIQFDEMFLPAEGITGIRHGRIPVGGAPVESPFTVAWWSDQGKVVLDGENFFGRGGMDEKAYGRIVDACRRWLCPHLVVWLAGIVQGGHPVFIENVSLTPDGVVFFYPDSEPPEHKSILVPYPELIHTVDADIVRLADRREPRRAVGFPAHATWNAVIVGDLIEALLRPPLPSALNLLPN